MKKVITYLLTVMLLLLSIQVYAIGGVATPTVINVEIDYTNMVFKLKTDIVGDRPHKAMLIVTKPDSDGNLTELADSDDVNAVKEKLYSIENKELSGEGEISFEIPISDSAAAGIYGFRLGFTGVQSSGLGEDEIAVYKGSKFYADATERSNVFALFNADNPDVGSLLTTYGKGAEREILNCDVSSSNNIYTSYQADVADFVKSIRRESIVTFADCTDVEKVFNASVALVDLNKNVIDASKLSTDVNDLYITPTSYFVGDTIVDTAAGLQNFKTAQGRGFSSLTEFKTEFEKAFFLAAVGRATREQITELVNGYPELGLSYGTANSNEVNKSLTDKTYSTIDEFKTAFNTSKTNVLNSTPPSHSGNGGNGGSLGFSGSASSGVAGGTVSPGAAQNKVFNDIDSVPWAEEAILYLSNHGINGKAEGIFAPNDVLTREEGVKMFVCALNVEIDGKIAPFDDVSINAWYYPYVAGAYEKGIVSGIGSNLFGIGNIFTREDFSVMLYNIIADYAVNSADLSVYNDSGYIADYAKEAVSHLSASGVINGMSDGSFAPKAPITRAQAAKMIYGIVKLLDGGNGI